MTTAILAFALIASLFHLLAFVLESLLFMRPKVHKRFGTHTTEEAQAARLFAFNQGFYNLFLAAGCLGGLALWQLGDATVGATLVMFSCACMAAAGLVLLASAPNKASAALMQALPPAFVLGLYFF